MQTHSYIHRQDVPIYVHNKHTHTNADAETQANKIVHRQREREELGNNVGIATGDEAAALAGITYTKLVCVSYGVLCRSVLPQALLYCTASVPVYCPHLLYPCIAFSYIIYHQGFAKSKTNYRALSAGGPTPVFSYFSVFFCFSVFSYFSSTQLGSSLLHFVIIQCSIFGEGIITYRASFKPKTTLRDSNTAPVPRSQLKHFHICKSRIIEGKEPLEAVGQMNVSSCAGN